MKAKKRNILVQLIILLTLIGLSIFALRENNLKMLELRDRVFRADETNYGLVEALESLRNHVTSNMNSSLPKLGDEKAIQLKYSYERAIAKEQEKYQNNLTKLSQDAKNACKNSVDELSRVSCEQSYIKNNPVDELNKIYPEQYSIEFVSPKWSFDLAGWLIISTFLVAISMIYSIIRFYFIAKK